MSKFLYLFCFFFFNDTATTEIYTLSLHDALPILSEQSGPAAPKPRGPHSIRTLLPARAGCPSAEGRNQAPPDRSAPPAARSHNRTRTASDSKPSGLRSAARPRRAACEPAPARSPPYSIPSAEKSA